MSQTKRAARLASSSPYTVIPWGNRTTDPYANVTVLELVDDLLGKGEPKRAHKSGDVL